MPIMLLYIILLHKFTLYPYFRQNSLYILVNLCNKLKGVVTLHKVFGNFLENQAKIWRVLDIA